MAGVFIIPNGSAWEVSVVNGGRRSAEYANHSEALAVARALARDAGLPIFEQVQA